MNTELSDEKRNQIVIETCLKVINVVTDKTSFRILQILPATVEEIEKKLDIGEYTSYRKLRRLERTRIINKKGEDNIITITDLGENLVKLLQILASEVNHNKELKEFVSDK